MFNFKVRIAATVTWYIYYKYHITGILFEDKNNIIKIKTTYVKHFIIFITNIIISKITTINYLYNEQNFTTYKKSQV